MAYEKAKMVRFSATCRLFSPVLGHQAQFPETLRPMKEQLSPDHEQVRQSERGVCPGSVLCETARAAAS